jgi:hypothetical protein
MESIKHKTWSSKDQKSQFCTSVTGSDPDCIRIESSQWIWLWEDKNVPLI